MCTRATSARSGTAGSKSSLARACRPRVHPSALPSSRPTPATPKPRLFEVLRSQGMQMNQQVVLPTDGGEDVHDLSLYLNPQSEQYLAWFHVTIRITVMAQMARSLRSCDKPDLATRVADELERLKWFLWHGN